MSTDPSARRDDEATVTLLENAHKKHQKKEPTLRKGHPQAPLAANNTSHTSAGNTTVQAGQRIGHIPGILVTSTTWKSPRARCTSLPTNHEGGSKAIMEEEHARQGGIKALWFLEVVVNEKRETKEIVNATAYFWSDVMSILHEGEIVKAMAETWA